MIGSTHSTDSSICTLSVLRVNPIIFIMHEKVSCSGLWDEQNSTRILRFGLLADRLCVVAFPSRLHMRRTFSATSSLQIRFLFALACLWNSFSHWHVYENLLRTAPRPKRKYFFHPIVISNCNCSIHVHNEMHFRYGRSWGVPSASLSEAATLDSSGHQPVVLSHLSDQHLTTLRPRCSNRPITFHVENPASQSHQWSRNCYGKRNVVFGSIIFVIYLQ